nr:hypothetical protein [Tanacetum cinerariifolium]
MVTRAQVGTVKTNTRFHRHTSHIYPISPIPKSPSVVLSDPNWYKARLVANGCSQQSGVDCYDTFSPVVKPATISTRIISSFHKEFDMTDLETLNYFLRFLLRVTLQYERRMYAIDFEFNIATPCYPNVPMIIAFKLDS